MTHSLHPRSRSRAPRVSLHGSISATIHLEDGRQLSAKLHQLSVTGGLLELSGHLPERTKVGLHIQIGSMAQVKAEMLFPMRGAMGDLQPFRFADLHAEECQILEKEISELLKRTMPPARSGHNSGFRPPYFYLESF